MCAKFHAKDIVVGDIVLLEAGEEIPADCELLESLNLNVDEFFDGRTAGI